MREQISRPGRKDLGGPWRVGLHGLPRDGLSSYTRIGINARTAKSSLRRIRCHRRYGDMLGGQERFLECRGGKRSCWGRAIDGMQKQLCVKGKQLRKWPGWPTRAAPIPGLLRKGRLSAPRCRALPPAVFGSETTEISDKSPVCRCRTIVCHHKVSKLANVDDFSGKTSAVELRRIGLRNSDM